MGSQTSQNHPSRKNRDGLTRRGILAVAGVGAVAAAGAFGPGAGDAGAGDAGAGTDGEAYGRIDVHHHAVPDAMRRWAVEQGLLPEEPEAGGPSWAEWTLDSTLEVMEDNAIAAGIASAPVPSAAFRDRRQAEEGVRICNESLAGLVADHPDRFGFFANVATHHVRLAIRQAAYALDELGAEGVILMTTTGDRYLGHPDFDPLFAALNERGAVVFVHPGPLPEGAVELPGISEAIGDFPLDTTRAALNLVASGTLDRFPEVSVILSHAGGFLPWAAGRAASAGRQGEGPDPAALRRALRRFHYDTALPMSPYATPTLLAAADPGRVMYGSDWPARPAGEVGTITEDLDADPALDPATLRRVNRDNALRLFPRLAARLRTGR
ncbi:amidohydrolase family protein [Streptomyces sp. 6N223]|uniref:amidohydrolase family protein n=1 Tax=Streptomyces sp. 6N223 TaxID=3457412 RepID=UPI003FCF18D1